MGLVRGRAPGLAMMWVVLGMMLLGDGPRGRFDPDRRGG
jgi:ABC-type dipeptide/oligopeptide/nickel transport system permease subunit